MTESLISSIFVENLFGLYTYSLPETGELSNAAILYGDNGVGKSTLLRLAFHLLSAANNRGHRTALYTTPFDTLEIKLSSGAELRAKFNDSKAQRLLNLEISANGKVLAIWEYHPKTEADNSLLFSDYLAEFTEHGIRYAHKESRKGQGDAVPRGNKAFLATLAKYVPTMFILTADRRLDSDSVADPSDEMELRRVMRYEEPKRINELVVRSREIALSQAMNSASRWAAQKAVIGANQGSMNVHSVYVDVLQHLISPQENHSLDSSEADINELLTQLDAIERRTREFSTYELATELSTVEFRKALKTRAKNKSKLAAQLLRPYIKSLEGRLEAVESIYRVVDKFVTTVNEFLSDKSIAFQLSHGFSIKNKMGQTLSPAQLSSGEQQLLLLFCYVLTAREHPSVFMIDEPEISLNIKWQRRLVQSLLNITEGATIQFVFASHSMELLAQHRNRVVRLVNQK